MSNTGTTSPGPGDPNYDSYLLSRLPKAAQDAINALTGTQKRDALRLLQQVASGQQVTDSRGQLMALGILPDQAQQIADTLQQQQGMAPAAQAAPNYTTTPQAAQGQAPQGTNQPGADPAVGTTPPGGTGTAPDSTEGMSYTDPSRSQAQDAYNRQAYDAYVQQYRIAAKRAGEDPKGAMPFDEWTKSTFTQKGPTYNAIEQGLKTVLDNKFIKETGHSMPPDLWAQVQSELGSSDPTALQQIHEQVAAANGDPDALLSLGLISQTEHDLIASNDPKAHDILYGSPLRSGVLSTALSSLSSYKFLDKILTTYTKANPTPADLKAQFVDLWQSNFGAGSKPPQDIIDKYYASPYQVQLDMMNQQTMPGTHLTLGAFKATKKEADSIWSTYWPTKTPTLADIEKIASFKDPGQIQDWVENQPSHIANMNIGTYSTLQKALDKLRPALWNMPNDTSFTATAASALQSATAAPAPAQGPAQPPADQNQWQRLGSGQG